MRLVGLMPVRNEDWVLEASIAAALLWCDDLVILLHACDDDSEDIAHAARDATGRVHVYYNTDPVWQEMHHREALLRLGRSHGGTHFALVDADEILTANAVLGIRAEVCQLMAGECLDVPMIPVWGGLDAQRADHCVWTRSWLTVAFRDCPALSWQPLHDGYQHHHRSPFASLPTARRPVAGTLQRRGGISTGGVMHLQFADRARLRAKHALYKMQEVLRWPDRESVEDVDAKYNQALNEEGLVLKPVPPEWWSGHKKNLIRIGVEPWQRAECRKLLSKWGPERFQGLTLWGEHL